MGMRVVSKKTRIISFLFFLLLGYAVGLTLYYSYLKGAFIFPKFRFKKEYYSFFNSKYTFSYVFAIARAYRFKGNIDLYYDVVFNLASRFALPIFCSIVLWVFLFGETGFSKEDKDLKGSAKWASMESLRQSDMAFGWDAQSLPNIFIGQSSDALLVKPHNSNFYSTKVRGKYVIGAKQGMNVLVLGGTGDGKGIGTIIPTLLTNRNSVICFDPKGENFDITGGYRQSFGRVQYFNPQDVKSTCHFNPFDFIRRNEDFVVTDIQNICTIILPTDNSSDNAFWTDKARYVIEVLMSFVLMYKKLEDQTMYSVARIPVTVMEDIKDYMRLVMNEDFVDDMVEFRNDPNINKDNVYMYLLIKKLIDSDRQFNPDMFEGNNAYRAVLARNMEILLSNILQEASSPQTVASYMSFANRELNFYLNENIAKLMDKTSFTIDDILFAKEPLSVYLCIAAADLSRCKTFVRLFVSCLLNSISSGDYSKKPEHPVLFLLDEFPQLGYLQEVEKAIKLLRGYGVSFMLVIQSLADLQDKKTYGPEGAMGIIDNCNIVDVKGVSNVETAKWVSERLGTKTVLRKKKSQTVHLGATGNNNDTVSKNTVEDSRPLLYPDEVARLTDDQLVLRRRGESALVKRAAYFEFDILKKRVKWPYSHAKEGAYGEK